MDSEQNVYEPMPQTELQPTVLAHVDYLLRPVDPESLADPSYTSSIASTRMALTNSLADPRLKTDAEVIVNQRLRDEVSLSLSSDEVIPEVSLGAWDRVNTALSDPVLRSFAERAVFFGYWTHLKTEHEANPQAGVRSDLISQITRLSMRKDLATDSLVDHVIAAVVELPREEIDSELIPASEHIEANDTNRNIATPRANELLQKSHAKLAAFTNATFGELIRSQGLNMALINAEEKAKFLPSTSDTPADIIKQYAGKPLELQALIEKGHFTSKPTRLAATMQVEIDLLTMHCDNVNALKINNAQISFKTVQGRAAYLTAVEKASLDFLVGKPGELAIAIDNEMFTTTLGLTAAKTQYDYDMLADAVDEVYTLRERLKHREETFKTKAMIHVAADRHDELVVQMYREHPKALRDAIMHGVFATKKGRASAQAILDLDI